MPNFKPNENSNPDSDPNNPAKKLAEGLLGGEKASGLGAGSKVGDKSGSPLAELGKKEGEGSAQPQSKPWDNKYSPKHLAANMTMAGRVKSIIGSKKGGATGLIITLVIGAIFAIGAIVTPSTLLFNLKEVLTGKFNDQLSVMDTRTTYILKKKIKSDVTACRGVINVRCKYQTMSNRMVTKLEKSGQIKVIGDKKSITGRTKVTALEFNGKRVDANSLLAEIEGDPTFKRALLYAYNPKFAGFADRSFLHMADRVGIRKNKNLEGSDRNALRKSMVENANGTAAIREKAGFRVQDNPDGTQTFIGLDENGQVVTFPDQAAYDEALSKSTAAGNLSKEIASRKALTEVSGDFAKASLKSALLSTAFGLGAVDSACTGYRLIRTVGFAAKYIGALTMARYAHTFLNQADATMAGVATAEENEFLGDTLTSLNAAGDSFSDSYGYQYAAFGYTGPPPSVGGYGTNLTSADLVQGSSSNPGLSEADVAKAELNDEVTRYVNGQMVGSDILASIISMIGGSGSVDEADETCGFVKSAWGQGIIVIAAIGGAVAAFFSFGTTLGWGVGVQIATSVAIGVAIAMLTPKLIDMASGTLIHGFENGNEAGNAVVSGAEAKNMLMNQSRALGVTPQSSVGEFAAANEKTRLEYIALENSDVSPFDLSSPYSALGSISLSLSNVTPKAFTAKSLMSSFSSIITSPQRLLNVQANAAVGGEFTTSCPDPEIQAMGVAAGPNCGTRGQISQSYIKTEVDTVLDFVLKNGHVDETTGEPISEQYLEYIENCIDRTDPIGTYSDEDFSTDLDLAKAKGVQCIDWESAGQANAQFASTSSGTLTAAMTSSELNMYRMFRLYHIDSAINEGMDNGFDRPATSPAPTSGTAPTGCDGPATLSAASNDGWGGFDNGKIPLSNMKKLSWTNHYLNPNAACGFEALNTKYKAKFGSNIQISGPRSAYRTYAQQVQMKAESGNLAAPPGTSNHGWGLAVDLSGGIGSFGTAQHKWMQANAPSNGWVNPPWAQQDGRKPEAWHWEYAREVE